jgi:hypothetical protein
VFGHCPKAGYLLAHRDIGARNAATTKAPTFANESGMRLDPEIKGTHTQRHRYLATEVSDAAAVEYYAGNRYARPAYLSDRNIENGVMPPIPISAYL